MIFRMLSRQTSRKYSAQWRLGCLSLSLGLLLRVFLHPNTLQWQIASHLATGILVGLSFGCFLMPSNCCSKRQDAEPAQALPPTAPGPQ